MNSIITTSQSEITSSRIEIIDALRGFGAVLITWYHLYQFSWHSFNFWWLDIHFKVDTLPRTGFMGVEIFFFLSAFGLFYPFAENYLEKKKKPDLKVYYYKRVKKIIPSYYLAIICILLFFNIDTFTSTSQAFTHISTHLLFIHNISTETFGSLNGVFWFMAVIFQLTIMFPILAYLFKKEPIVSMLIFCILAQIYRSYVFNNFKDTPFFVINQVPGFLDIIALGMFSAFLIVLIRSKISRLDYLKIPMTILSIIFIFLFFSILSWINTIEDRYIGIFSWQVNFRILYGFILLGITVTSTFALPIWRKILANPLLKFFNTISYNLFIWHFIIAKFFLHIHFPSYTTADPHNDAIWRISYFFITLGISIVIATIITYSFEKPLLRLTKKQIKTFKMKIISFFNQRKKNKC